MMNNIVSGLSLGVIGIFSIIYSNIYFEFGTIRNIGPAFFPSIIGFLLTICGATIALQNSDLKLQEKINWRSLLVVSTSLLVFSVTLKYLGILMSMLLTMLILNTSTSLTVRQNIVFSVIVAVVCFLIFKLLFY